MSYCQSNGTASCTCLTGSQCGLPTSDNISAMELYEDLYAHANSTSGYQTTFLSLCGLGMRLKCSVNDSDLVKHLFEVVLGATPGGHCITEEHKVLEHSVGVHGNHGTDTTEGRVLFLIVSDVAQRVAPHADELGEKGCHFPRTHQPQPPNGDGCVLEQSLWGALAIDVLNELPQHQLHVWLHCIPHLHGELPNSPCGIVAH